MFDKVSIRAIRMTLTRPPSYLSLQSPILSSCCESRAMSDGLNAKQEELEALVGNANSASRQDLGDTLSLIQLLYSCRAAETRPVQGGERERLDTFSQSESSESSNSGMFGSRGPISKA